MEAALAVCRFAHFSSAMVAFGASAYLWLLAPDGLRRALSPRLRPALLAAGAIALISAILWLALEAAGMAEAWSGAWDREMLEGVLFDTAFGRVWQAQLALCGLLVGALALRGDRWGLRTGSAGLVLATLGLTGHAAMQTGALGAAHRANDALHLLCGGAWLGGLLPFVLCLRMCTKSEMRDAAVAAMRRYSWCGHVFVALVVLSGMTNLALTTDPLPVPPSTPYRALLTIKLALVVVLVSLAVVNRYGILPRWKLSRAALGALRVTSAAEIALGVGIVALVGVFGLLDPG